MVHETAVALSVSSFFIRGLRRLFDAVPVGGRLTKSLPHLVDTVLLLSAVTLAWMLRINPLNSPWLMAKVCGLVAYVGLGIVAMRTGVSFRLRLAAWLAALLTVGWIISVAITKSPLGALSLI